MESTVQVKKKNSTARLSIIIALVLCLTSVIGANLIQTSGGEVKISNLAVETDQGTISMLLFKPMTATVDNPAPAVIASHGMFNSKEMQDIASVELARRGIVVISIDMFAHGHSSNVDSPRYVTNTDGKYYNVDTASFVDTREEATAFNAHGMIETVEYVWNNLNFVDRDRIGVTGHSMGGVNSTLTTRYYHYQATVGDGTRKISAALMQACNEATLPGELDGVDVGYINGIWDEMFTLAFFNPAIREMGINNVPQLNQFQAQNFVSEYAGYTEAYEIGTFVYNEEGNIRVYNTINGDHPAVHFSTDAAEDMINFFTASFGVQSDLPVTNQVWLIKELFNGLGLIGFFMFILQFAVMMLKRPFFSSLVAKVGALEANMLERPTTKLENAFYIIGMIALAFLPGFLYYPFMNIGLLKKSAVFPQTMTNNQAIWVFLVGLINIAFVALMFFTLYKRKGYAARNLGLIIKDEGESAKMGLVKTLKTILLALLTIAAGYFIVFVLYDLFNADFRLWTFAVKTFEIDRIGILLRYLIFFLVWSFGLTLAVNMNFRKGQSEGLILAVTTVANIVGISIPLLTYYLPFMSNGMPNSTEFINPILLVPVVPLIAIVTIYARRLYKRTGNIYLSTILNAVLIGMIVVVNTHIAYPHWFI